MTSTSLSNFVDAAYGEQELEAGKVKGLLQLYSKEEDKKDARPGY